jgi:hypothetical protein
MACRARTRGATLSTSDEQLATDVSEPSSGPHLRAVEPQGSAWRAHLAEWWQVWLVGLCSRFGVLVAALGAQYAAGQRGLEHGNFLTSGTYGHYASIATHGYTLKNAYDFPLMPAVMKLGSFAGLPFSISAFLVTNIAFVIGLVGFAMLGARYVGKRGATRAAMYLALFPFAGAFSQASTEGLMLMLLTGSVLFALRGTWWASALLAALCALARPPAMFVLIPLAAIAWSRYRSGDLKGNRLVAAIAAIGAGPAAVFAFFAYLNFRTGDFLASVHAQGPFGRHLSIMGPVHAVSDAVGSVRDGVIGPGIELVALAIAAGAALWFWMQARGDRSERLGWVTFAAASLALPLATGLVWQIPRFALLVPPVFWAVALIGRRAWIHQALLILLPMALALRTVFDVVGATQ